MHSHEKELERTSHNIKELIKEVKNLINTAKNLSKAQRSLASHLINFRFDCIGSNQTDDELVIAGSLKEFGRLINTIEVVLTNFKEKRRCQLALKNLLKDTYRDIQ